MSGWYRTYSRLIAVAAWAASGAAAAQVAPPPPIPAHPQAALPTDDRQPDDIVVEGYRTRSDIKTSVASPTETSAVANRRTFEYSERVAQCAGRSKLSDLRWFRATVDGAFNSSEQAYAQDRLKRIYITCSESSGLLSVTTSAPTALQVATALSGESDGLPAATDSAPLGHSIYDRGAFVIEAIRRFAPDLTLTRAQTNDPAIQARLNAREIPRNAKRLPVDYRYFETAICMVRVEPRLAVRLAMSERPARAGDLQAALIDRARVCVGGARQVRVDPTQFRIYIADAVYRWAVAVKGVDSLIPDQAG